MFFTNFLLLDDRARRSPRKLPTSLKKGERKWAPPKFLPHKYDVKLQNEDKVSWHFIFFSYVYMLFYFIIFLCFR